MIDIVLGCIILLAYIGVTMKVMSVFLLEEGDGKDTIPIYKRVLIGLDTISFPLFIIGIIIILFIGALVYGFIYIVLWLFDKEYLLGEFINSWYK